MDLRIATPSSKSHFEIENQKAEAACASGKTMQRGFDPYVMNEGTCAGKIELLSNSLQQSLVRISVLSLQTQDFHWDTQYCQETPPR